MHVSFSLILAHDFASHDMNTYRLCCWLVNAIYIFIDFFFLVYYVDLDYDFMPT